MWKIICLGKVEYTESSDIAYKAFYDGADVYKMRVDEIVQTTGIPNVIFKWVHVHPKVNWEDY
jgi:hypothetical protein